MTTPQNPTPQNPMPENPTPGQAGFPPPSGSVPPQPGQVPQQPYPQEGQPYAPAGYQPVAGQPYPGAPGGMPGPAPVPAKKRGRTWLILLVVAVVLVGAGIAAGMISDANQPKVGDCLAKSGSNSVKKVACTSSDATYQVVSLHEDVGKPIGNVASMNPCSSDPQADSSYWEGRSGSKGRLLCLKTL